jgi:putative transposase
MKKGRFSEEQIIGVLKQHEAGRKVPEVAREIGVSEATIYLEVQLRRDGRR